MTSNTTAAAFLMFQGKKAEEALKYYANIIPNTYIQSITHYDDSGKQGAPGSVKLARASIGGLPVMAIDSSVQHAFDFTPSMSLYINLPDEETIADVSTKLVDGGKELMPLGEYGFSKKYAWVQDRFGVSWQLNLD
jgi:predicted 3-demethylubiquinone-9 3-methyltransferase (glyoxalase superfamily)